jgi:hypothetical protein
MRQEKLTNTNVFVESAIGHKIGSTMKFKLIKSMAHSWTHSFMRGENHIDKGYVFKDLHRLARKRKGEKIIVSWIPEKTEELLQLTPRVRIHIGHYRNSLSDHLLQHKIDPASIKEMRTEVYVARNLRMYVRSYVLDITGKEHVQFVWA